jgi:hypothetical protein
MAAGPLRRLLLLALALAEPPFPRRPLVPPRENMMPWYTAGKPSRESSGPPTEHTYKHQEATGMRLLRQRAAELSSPPPTNGRGWISRTGTGCRNLLLLLSARALSCHHNVQPTIPLHPPACGHP